MAAKHGAIALALLFPVSLRARARTIDGLVLDGSSRFLPPPAAWTAARSRPRRASPSRLERLKPLLDKVGLRTFLRGGQTGLSWGDGREIVEPKLSAYLDELEWLSSLPGRPAGTPRPPRENLLWDYDRQRLEAAYFEPSLKAMGDALFEAQDHNGVLLLAADGTLVSGGRLDAYLRSLEEARRTRRVAPAFRGYDLVPGLDSAWAPGVVRARPGDYLSLRLINPGAQDAVFRLDAYGVERRVAAGGGTVVSLIAGRPGFYLYNDPLRPAASPGTLSIQP